MLLTLYFKLFLKHPKNCEDGPRRAPGEPCARKYLFYNVICDTRKGPEDANQTKSTVSRAGGRAKGRVNPPLRLED